MDFVERVPHTNCNQGWDTMLIHYWIRNYQQYLDPTHEDLIFHKKVIGMMTHNYRKVIEFVGIRCKSRNHRIMDKTMRFIDKVYCPNKSSGLSYYPGDEAICELIDQGFGIHLSPGIHDKDINLDIVSRMEQYYNENPLKRELIEHTKFGNIAEMHRILDTGINIDNDYAYAYEIEQLADIDYNGTYGGDCDMVDIHEVFIKHGGTPNFSDDGIKDISLDCTHCGMDTLNIYLSMKENNRIVYYNPNNDVFTMVVGNGVTIEIHDYSKTQMNVIPVSPNINGGYDVDYLSAVHNITEAKRQKKS